MNYQEALAYMKKIEKYGSVPGLESIRELLHRLGDPQEHYPVVQIAGTNGKGSTGAFLTTILLKAGCKVGRFFSPAVFCERETISFQGQMIPEDMYAVCMEEVSQVADAMEKDGLAHPTSFEVETALAYLYFSKCNCELAVVECGMGGALDATNVLTTNLLSIITPISMDHVSFLGTTLRGIAEQKAGIIKEGRPVITLWQDSEVNSVLMRQSEKLHASLRYIDTDLVHNYEFGLEGSFQKTNGALAVLAAHVLQEEGLPITEEHIRMGLLHTRWRGRFEQIGKHPDIWIDGAHNPHGARALKEAFQRKYYSGKAQIVMGVFKDKAAREMCEILKPCMEHVYTITPPGPRGMDAGRLSEIVKETGVLATPCDSVAEALKKAIQAAGKDGVVLAFGSLSYLKQIEVRNV